MIIKILVRISHKSKLIKNSYKDTLPFNKVLPSENLNYLGVLIRK